MQNNQEHQYSDTQSVIEAIEASGKLLEDYLDDSSDPRRQIVKGEIRNKVNEPDFNKTIIAAKGVYYSHKVNVFGETVPIRLISTDEEEALIHKTLIEFKEFPEYLGGENHPVFQNKLLKKKLSLATSINPFACEDNNTHRYYTNAQIGRLPQTVLNYLSYHYDQIEKLYNMLFNENFEAEVTFIIHALFDGEGMTEKKLVLLNGSSSVQSCRIITRLFNALTKLQDNAIYITLQDELKQSVLEEEANLKSKDENIISKDN